MDKGTNIIIYPAKRAEANMVAELAIQMWEDNTVDGLAKDFKDLISNAEAVVFLAKWEENAVGFAQCQLRHDYVEGTDSSPVGYLEGIFVQEEYRGRGIAKQLLKACENWAGGMGCTEFASDCELTNSGSFKFHMSMGFEEANRIICFTKKL